MVFDDIKEIPKHYPNGNRYYYIYATIMGIMLTIYANQGLEMFNIIDPK
jgi:hypothetical protein